MDTVQATSGSMSATAPVLGDPQRALIQRIESREAIVGVVGLGYVGLPLAIEMTRSRFRTIGFDVDQLVVERLNGGESHIPDVPGSLLAEAVAAATFVATDDFSRLADCDAVLICVPTPLNKIKDPDLSYVIAAVQMVRDVLRPGQLIVLESTTYPGTTREVVLPVLEGSGLTVGTDFFLCFSPERVDPGNQTWRTRNTPKVLGGITARCQEAGLALYERTFDTVVPVSSAEAAELVKVYENTFRMINIALANEIAQVCERLGIDVWEVVDAAATKPFGFMKFVPGPGIGGHCIPLDPHYLSWKMRNLSFQTRMIQIASEINENMPQFVVGKVIDALNDERVPVNGSRVLVLGVSYKRDVGDVRESPALEIIRILQEKGADICYHDHLCPRIDAGSGAALVRDLESVDLSAVLLGMVDVVVIATDHSDVDYQFVADHARLVVDARGVMRAIAGKARIVGLSGPRTRDTPKSGQ